MLKEKSKKNKRNKQSTGKKELKKAKEKAITLIALIVTIIVLLILAGVSITILTGEILFMKMEDFGLEDMKLQILAIILISRLKL